MQGANAYHKANPDHGYFAINTANGRLTIGRRARDLVSVSKSASSSPNTRKIGVTPVVKGQDTYTHAQWHYTRQLCAPA